MSSVKVLTVNPGSTSTKIAVFVDEQNIFQKNIKHSVKELAPFGKIADQFEFRRDMILQVFVMAFRHHLKIILFSATFYLFDLFFISLKILDVPKDISYGV